MLRPQRFCIKDAAGEVIKLDNGAWITFDSAMMALACVFNGPGCTVWPMYPSGDGPDATWEISRWPYGNQTVERERASWTLRDVLPILKVNPTTSSDIEKAVAAGMYAKKVLVDGAYYYGHCRNARVARWDANGSPSGFKDGRTGRFVHIRHKFGDSFPEAINHPEDDNRYDFFVPVAKIEPTREEEVSDESLRDAR